MATSARIDELRKKFDENPRRYFAPLANEYRKVGDLEQAIFICQEYLPQQPGHMSGHIVFGQALFEAKRLPEARTVFETALTLDPENLIALRHLGDISRDLGESDVARGWYERVLQADPRNEEIAGIMSSMLAAGAAPGPPISPTAETPAQAQRLATTSPAATAVAGSPAAPTVELSAAAVQEMMRARMVAKGEQAPAKSTLDEAATIALGIPDVPAALEGLESTAHAETLDLPVGGMMDMPTGGLLDAEPAPPTFDLPAGGMLDLEPTAATAAPAHPVPDASSSEGDDALSLDDFSLPTAGPAASAHLTGVAPSAPGAEAAGLLDFDSLEMGGGAATTSDPAPPGSAAVPIDGGTDGAMDFDFEVPGVKPSAAPPPSMNSVPTLVMETVEDLVPTAVDAAQESISAIIDVVEDAVPTLVAAVTGASTLIMDAIRVDSPRAGPPPVAQEPEPLAPTQQMDVASVMQQIDTSRASKTEPEPAERSAPAFVTETMAQLYLEQGHRTEAIEIYRQLVAARPTDLELRGRLEAIERGTGSRAPQIAQVPAASGVSTRDEAIAGPGGTFNASGPSIRAVLRELFGVDSMATHGNGSAIGGPSGELGSIDILFSADAVVDGLTPLAVAFDGGYVAPLGSIDAVFAGDDQ